MDGRRINKYSVKVAFMASTPQPKITLGWRELMPPIDNGLCVTERPESRVA